MKVCVIGLGSMGYGIALSLLRARQDVCGVDVDPQRVRRLRADGAVAEDISNFVREAEAVVVVVLNATQTENVLFGEKGIVPTLPKGAVVICCVTVPPDFARDMAIRCGNSEVLFLDAPISGGSARAAEGRLAIMASGTPEAFRKSRPILEAIAETIFELGDRAGAGSAMKAVNQMLAGTHIAIMAEAITFAISQGILPETFLRVIPECAGTSWMLENRAPRIVAGDYTPRSAISIWSKDLGIVLDIARASNFSAPITTVVLQQFVAATSMGLSDEDDAAVAKVYAQTAGVQLPGTP